MNAQALKAQVIFEYMIVFMIMLLISSAFSIYMLDLNGLAFSESRSLERQRIADLVASEVNTAFLSGDGYSHPFFLPENIRGEGYEISIEPAIQTVWIEQDGSPVAHAYIINSNVSGSAKPGQNTVVSANGGVQIS